MNISSDELKANGFQRGGTVCPDPTPLRCLNPGSQREKWEGLFRVENMWDVQGYVVYIMVVNHEFKKAGHTGKGGARFKTRMEGSFNCLRPVIAGGPPYLGDPFKQHAPATILAQQDVELWAKPFPSLALMMAKESELNDKYEGELTKEGQRRANRQPDP
jgi:hypothetical protein